MEEYLYCQKLTKKFLMGLPTGVYIIGNSHKEVEPNIYTPFFHSYVAPPEKREIQWANIKNLRCNHKLCYVFLDFARCQKCMTSRSKEGSATFVISENIDFKI